MTFSAIIMYRLRQRYASAVIEIAAEIGVSKRRFAGTQGASSPIQTRGLRRSKGGR
jgi:hypothetical protein